MAGKRLAWSRRRCRPCGNIFRFRLRFAIFAVLFLIILCRQQGPSIIETRPQNETFSKALQENGNHDQTIDADTSTNRIIYVGKFGLGHRLSKMSAAYHWAQQMQQKTAVKILFQVDWGRCQHTSEEQPDGGSIFEHLFGDNILNLPSKNNDYFNGASKDTANSNNKKELWIRNDVHGYYAGQNYKNARQPLPTIYRHRKQDNYANSPWFQKMESDLQLFQWLEERFHQHHPDAWQFMQGNYFDNQNYDFSHHTVIGVHIRAGNGEQDHFVQANRVNVQVDFENNNHDNNSFLANFLQLLQQFLTESKANTHHYTFDKPPLIFLATDTPSVIPILQQAATTWKIPLVTFPQPQLPDAGGVTYSQLKTGQSCLEAWKAMITDMILLGQADILVAAMRSSFTQIMPMAQVWNRKGTVCEVSELGHAMSCLQSQEAWLFRDRPDQEWTLRIHSNNNTSASDRVVHKVMVHFPDVDSDDQSLQRDYQSAIDFFHPQQTTADSMVWGGGRTINAKYRKKAKGKPYTTEWTFA